MLKKLLFICFFVLFVIATARHEGPATGIFVMSANAATSEELREQTIGDFKQWRATIPDYEKRLYDRVKGLNMRVIRNTNVTVILLLAIFLALPFWLRFINKHMSCRHRTENDAMSAEVQAAAPTNTTTSIDSAEMSIVSAEIQKNQELLAELLVEVEDRISSYLKKADDLNKHQGDLEELVSRARVIFDVINQNLPEDRPGNSESGPPVKR